MRYSYLTISRLVSRLWRRRGQGILAVQKTWYRACLSCTKLVRSHREHLTSPPRDFRWCDCVSEQIKSHRSPNSSGLPLSDNHIHQPWTTRPAHSKNPSAIRFIQQPRPARSSSRCQLAAGVCAPRDDGYPANPPCCGQSCVSAPSYPHQRAPGL